MVQPIQGQDEDRPPPGEKIRKLLASGDERAARELRLQVLWTRQPGEELVAMGAPVVKTIDDCLDPERAYELLLGKTRSSTLKRYVTMYRRWRLWLQEAKRVDPPGRPADLVDYLLVLRDEPYARTVPDSLLKAVSWMDGESWGVQAGAPRYRRAAGPLRTRLSRPSSKVLP